MIQPRIRFPLMICGVLLVTGATAPVTFAQGPAASKKSDRIVKWVDEKGVTHYGDSLPLEQANKASVVLDKKGAVVKQNDASPPPEERVRLNEEKEKQERLALEQERRDKYLLNAYSNEKDIELAEGRDVRSEESTIQTLEVNLGSAHKKLDENQKFAAGLQARKKPLPADLVKDIELSKKDVSRIEGQIEQKRKEIKDIREHYAEDKRRFRELKGYKAPAAAPVAPSAQAAPTPAPAAPSAPAARPAAAPR